MEIHNQDVFEEKALKKLIKAHGSLFVSELFSCSKEELEQKIVSMAKHGSELDDFLKQCDEYQELQAQAKIISDPINEQKRENKKKTKIILEVMKGRFGEVQ